MDETLTILSENRGAIYSMGGGLMRLKRDIEGFLVFDEIPKPALRTIIERMVEYVRVSKHGLAPVDVPRDIIDMIATLPDYKQAVWRLQEIINTPTLGPDGAPILSRGYHEALELYLDCPEDLEDLDLTGDPQAAFDRVADLLVDMPFERPEHKAVAMCSFITPIVRSAIDGPVPLVIFDSAVRGSGKTTLADLTSLIATGRSATIQPYVDETEFEKRVTALLQLGLRTVLIDNIDRPFGGATLDALLTANMWTGRVLGQTKMIKFRSRAHWMATGNNIQIKGDLDRRALRCYITPNMERPEERRPEDYKYPKIREHVRLNRRAYVQDILTFTKAFMDLGCPQIGHTKGLGSFEDWSRVVRGAVMYFGMADPVNSQDALRQDGVATLWSQVISACHTIYQGNEFSARDVYMEAFVKQSGIATKEQYNNMESALEELVGTKPTVRAVAFTLKKWLNRVVNGRKLVKAPARDRDKGHVYLIEVVA
jgi:putative DNA primase/helicase